MTRLQPASERVSHAGLRGGESVASLADFDFEALLHDSVLALYRGRHRSSPSTVLMVQAAAASDGIDASLQLNHEYGLRKILDPAWALVPQQTVVHEGRLSLLYHDIDVVSLDQITSHLLDIDVFFEYAMPMANAVRRMHATGLQHNNLKPSTVLVQRDGTCRLRSFGTAWRTTEEGMQDQPRLLAATHAYMSPEHTGRTKHMIDARSDLYSLGVMFYELLTGLLPFNLKDGTESMEWIHQHLASEPSAPHLLFPEIPKQLSSLVLKLLAKNPGSRYQTAAGLERDLRRCHRSWKLSRRIDEFPLGAQDIGAELGFSNKLYSREDNLQVLLAAFEQVRATRSRTLAIVHGQSGVGKSALLASLLSQLRQRDACVALGKIDQYGNDLPYAAIVQALESLIMRIIGQPDKELLFWRNRLMQRLGEYGALALNLIPALGYLVGELPPVPDLPALETQNRFRTVMQRLFSALASPGRPMVLVIDDVQWIDLPSVQLLEYLMKCAEEMPLLLVLAYREEEKVAGAPFNMLLSDVRPNASKVFRTGLAALDIKAVERMVAGALRQNVRGVRELAALVHGKTDGNPFFVKQFLKAAVDDGLVAFDPSSAVWNFDLAAIRNRDYTDNVAALVLLRLSRLPSPTRDVLGTLACLGRRSSLELLARLHADTAATVSEMLEPAIEAEAVFLSKENISFHHDRVQEAAYLLIDEQRRSHLHLRVGRMLLDDFAGSAREEDLFKAFDHLAIASPLIVVPGEREHVARLGLQAARKARRAIAYGSALKFIDSALTLIRSENSEACMTLIHALELERADCLLLAGSLDDADQVVRKLLLLPSSLADKTNACRIKAEIHLRRSENSKTVDVVLEGLRPFGIRIERHPTDQDCETAYQRLSNKLTASPEDVLFRLPPMQNPDVQAAMSLLSVLFPSAAFTDDRLNFIQICQTLELTLEFGMTGSAAIALGSFGAMVTQRFGNSKEGFRYAQLAQSLVTQHRYLPYESRSLLQLGLLGAWTRPLSFSVDCTTAGFKAGIAHGDVTMACIHCCAQVVYCLARGDHLDAVQSEAERGLSFVQHAGYRDVEAILKIQIRFIENLRKAENVPFSGNGIAVSYLDEFTGQGRERMSTLVFWFWLYKAISHYLAGEFGQAAASIKEAEQFAWSAPAHVTQVDFHVFYALIIAAGGDASLDSNAIRAGIQPHYEKLVQWAEANPGNFSDKKALVGAEMARVSGDPWTAQTLYGTAIRHAESQGFLQYAAFAHELAARFCMEHDLQTSAEAHVNCARNAYRSWGAFAKARRLEQVYPRLFQHAAGPLANAAVAGGEESWQMSSVLRSVRALSEEIRLDSSVKILMTIAIEHAGAQRGLLIRNEREVPVITARATTSLTGVDVDLLQRPPSEKDLPLSMLHTTMRSLRGTHFAGNLHASAFQQDPYLQGKPHCAAMCIPLVKRGELIGVLFLENCHRPDAFTEEQVRVLEVIAAQAAISLEVARLYADLVDENQQRQRAETALRASEAKLELGEQITHTGSWQWDTNENVVSASAEACRIFGRDPDQRLLSLSDFLAYIHEDDRSVVVDTLRLCTEERKPFHVEYRIVRPDGTIRYVSGVGKLAIGDDNVGHFVGTVTDITERRGYEDALRTSQAELARVARITTVGQLTASIAHEINQPLMSIVSNGGASLRWLKRNPPELGEVLVGLEEIVSEAGRAGHIIHSLQALTRNSAPVMQQLDAHEIVRRILTLARSDIERRTVSVQLSLAAAWHAVNGDSIQLQQVLLNLVVNAVEAMSEISDRPRTLSIYSENPDDDHIMVSVKDTGIGLTAEDMAKVFEAFFTTKQNGMGMGLAISQSIVEAHDGRLQVLPASPHGSIFQLILPVAHAGHRE